MEKEENPKIEESKEGKQGVIPPFLLREHVLFSSLKLLPMTYHSQWRSPLVPYII